LYQICDELYKYLSYTTISQKSPNFGFFIIIIFFFSNSHFQRKKKDVIFGQLHKQVFPKRERLATFQGRMGSFLNFLEEKGSCNFLWANGPKSLRETLLPKAK
jgi:hypothetical protein